jgi:hypothetical protein
MPINKSAKHINLLPQDDFQTTGIGRVLKWALSTFRVMVIVTELVVMSAFLSRFWLDSKNSDLNEAMGIKKAQVMAYKEVEKEFRSYQTKLSIASSLYLEGSNAKLLKGIQDLMHQIFFSHHLQKMVRNFHKGTIILEISPNF